ncbi:hypothetical protein QQS21_006444 [Conoideocrella luteorostrata]|uniref:Secreted protein NIS1 n=1 Tax=Conoideocrella luteorostrata TaxID=1105319 RepID=A0AAJ0CMT3_9HYPO|nr:hypothetical protein QQS21_006444 [Conoideocrella luteorostrata]
MRTSFSLVAGALLSVTQARITGIAVPDTIKPGDTIDAVIHSSNYIQTVYDVAIAFGYSSGNGYPQSLGVVAGSMYLGPAESNKAQDFSKKVLIPASAPKGRSLITASLMSLYGAASAPTLSNYNVTVMFGDETSKNYVSSHY